MRVEAVRNATERELADFHPDFTDERLPELLVHYKARNYPRTLSEGEMAAWEAWRTRHLQAQLPGFVKDLQRLAATTTDDNKQFCCKNYSCGPKVSLTRPKPSGLLVALYT